MQNQQCQKSFLSSSSSSTTDSLSAPDTVLYRIHCIIFFLPTLSGSTRVRNLEFISVCTIKNTGGEMKLLQRPTGYQPCQGEHHFCGAQNPQSLMICVSFWKEKLPSCCPGSILPTANHQLFPKFSPSSLPSPQLHILDYQLVCLLFMQEPKRNFTAQRLKHESNKYLAVYINHHINILAAN